MLIFSAAGNLLAGQHDCEKEREPPARPIPVTFPTPDLPEASIEQPPAAWAESTSSLPKHFLSLKKPSDVGLETLKLLNVSFGPECDFDTLVPYAHKTGDPYLPPSSWFESPTRDINSKPPGLLSNGRRGPDRNDFWQRAKELLHNNEDAFAALSRKPKPGQVPPRLAHFRKFWEGLDNWAYYWDNSLDEYLPPKEESPGSRREKAVENAISNAEAKLKTGLGPIKKQKTESTSLNGTPELPFPSMDFGADPLGFFGFGGSFEEALLSGSLEASLSGGSHRLASTNTLPARPSPAKVPWAANMPSVAEKPIDLSKGSYRGYRIGNGADMPDQYRLECVRGFLEAISWAFGVTFVPHRKPPVLCIGNVRFPVRMNTVGWKSPKDRMAARRGILEGPALGVQCRPDVFGLSGNVQAESLLDVARELGGLLLLAQERAREGTREKRAGEGKWWTTKPRWGGGPGGETIEAINDAPEPRRTTLSAGGRAGQTAQRLADGQGLGKSKRIYMAEHWKVLRPSVSHWDPKIMYEATGKERGSDWDEIFMVSSINHHICVLKLRVHRLYLQFLADNELPMTDHVESAWWSPSLQRTRWFNLFDKEDRKEAMRGLWGVMGYLMRSEDELNDHDTME